MEVLHGVFTVFKFLFGLGALGALLGIGLALLWYALRCIVRITLQDQPPDRCLLLRKWFLEP
jgi:hypothetical protein